jgi:hypothetical protein
VCVCVCAFCVCVYYVLAGGAGAVASQGSLASKKRRAVKGFAPVEAAYHRTLVAIVAAAGHPEVSEGAGFSVSRLLLSPGNYIHT